MPGPTDDDRRPPTSWPFAANPSNPRTYPAHAAAAVDHEVRRADLQRRDLEQTMAATGQSGALVIAHLEARTVPGRGACTVTTWAEGPITVLPEADVIVLFELPATVDGQPRTTTARWDVVARVCGPDCWRVVPQVDPPRVITSRWPSTDQLEVIRNLSLPDAPS